MRRVLPRAVIAAVWVRVARGGAVPLPGLRARPAADLLVGAPPVGGCPVSPQTTLPWSRLPPEARNRRTPAGVAAEAGSQPMPIASIVRFASMISSSVTSSTTQPVYRIAETART